MANTIQLRRSATANAVPTTAQLALGELAINTTDGKLYLKKNVSGTESIVEIGGGGASISVSDTAPASPINGSLWWDTTVGQLKIYYTDGTSNQWVDAINISAFVPKATATSLGAVEIFDDTIQTVAANPVTSTASRTYGVQLNANDQMVVNVPWSGGITVSDTAPASPINGSLWWNSTVGVLKIYYIDGTSSQWVDAVPAGSSTASVVTYPQNVQNGNYTLVLGDAGKHIYSTNAGAQTITIPTNASVAFPIGTIITIVNRGTNPIVLSASGVSIFTNNFPVAIPTPTVPSNSSIQIIKMAENSWASTFGSFSSNNPTVTYLVVGGGGGGGRYSSGTVGGGGGGGGGLVTGSTTLAGLTIYSVTIGAGGTAATGTGDLPGTNGANSSFNGINGLGGGAGGGGNAGSAGGSGGGGWWLAAGGAAQQPGSSSGGFGNAGGAGSYQSDFTRVTGGSGGGAGAAAANSVNGSAQNGGAGLASSITGTSVTYAGGGAGGSTYSSGAGGTGGGGNPGVAGGTNTGGGAGANATGGSGVVIISSPVAALYVTGSPVVTTSGVSTIYTFTSSGTIAF